MTTDIFDLVIIGSGPGGYPAALKAASLGKKVAIIEKNELGGVCLNSGCIPTKTIIASAKIFSKLQRANEFGIETTPIEINWEKIIDRKNKVVLKLKKALEFSLKKANVEIIKGEGEIKSNNCVTVKNENKEKEIKTKNIILATGVKKRKFKEFETALTSDEILNIENLPKSIAIIGAGAVGVEFANIFATFNVKVTLYEIMPNILPQEDKDISNELKKILEKKNVEIICGKQVSKNDINSEIIMITGNDFEKIEVNQKMQTNIHGIYATGDITAIAPYAHVAIMQSLVAAENICGTESEMDYSAIPHCVFTTPEIASVGITEQQAIEKNIDYSSKIFNFAALGKSNCDGELEGFVKIIIDNKTKRILGCHIIGENASDIIEEVVLAIKHRLTISDLSKTIHAHPTLPEAIFETIKMFT